MVQLATSMKRKISEVVIKCLVDINGLVTTINLNILLLGPYDMLIRMDLLELHRTKFDHKIIERIDDKGKFQVIKGIPKSIYIRKIMTLQMRKYFTKTFLSLHTVHL